MPNTAYIEKLFNKIAFRYDLLNNLLSLGTHWLWKKKLVKSILMKNPQRVLDAATGTGDIAGLIKEKNNKIEVVGVDLSQNMIKYAKKKFTNIEFIVSDLNKLDDFHKSFDSSCISFGIRNTDDVSVALVSLASYTKKTVHILEFGQPENQIFKKLYFGVMHIFIPIMGYLFQSKESYKYLVESSEVFPSAQQFIEVAEKTNQFKNCHYTPLFGGICYLYELNVK